MNGICVVCKSPIVVMCRKGTGLCGENCQKKYEQINTDNAAEFSRQLLASSVSLNGVK